MRWNGMQRNRMELNRKGWDGMESNEIEWNGLE